MTQPSVRNRGTRFYLPPDLLRGLKVAAAERDCSASEIVRDLVGGYLSRTPAKGRSARKCKSCGKN